MNSQSATWRARARPTLAVAGLHRPRDDVSTTGLCARSGPVPVLRRRRCRCRRHSPTVGGRPVRHRRQRSCRHRACGCPASTQGPDPETAWPPPAPGSPSATPSPRCHVGAHVDPLPRTRANVARKLGKPPTISTAASRTPAESSGLRTWWAAEPDFWAQSSHIPRRSASYNHNRPPRRATIPDCVHSRAMRPVPTAL